MDVQGDTGSFEVAWDHACEAAGYPRTLVHDFRRTAVRNLERAGVPRSTAATASLQKAQAS